MNVYSVGYNTSQPDAPAVVENLNIEDNSNNKDPNDDEYLYEADDIIENVDINPIDSPKDALDFIDKSPRPYWSR